MVHARVFIYTWTDLTFFSVFQCEFCMSVECMSADPQMFVCVCMGKGSILDKHLLMTLRAWELQLQRQKRERTVYKVRESS